MLEIPFPLEEHDFIVIQGLVYKERKQRIVNFVLDTGASTTMFAPNIMRSIGYSEDCREYISPARVSGPAGKQEGFRVKAQKILVHSIECALADIDVVCIRPEKNVEALLGLNFLRNFRYCVDHRKHLLTLEKI